MIKLREINYETFKKDVYQEYTKLFPKNERQTKRKLKKAYNQGILKFIQIFNDDTKIGFLIYICLENNPYIWLDYFAIYHEYQNQKYGTKAIQAFKKYFSSYDGIYGEIESLGAGETEEENQIRAKRIKFWETLGFEILNIDVILFGVKYSTCALKLKKTSQKNIDIVHYGFSLYKALLGSKHIQENCFILLNTKEERNK